MGPAKKALGATVPAPVSRGRKPVSPGPAGGVAHRVSLRLDAGILVEGLILGRLADLPKPRHQDWLRSLLVQGYLAESRLVRAVQAGLEKPAGVATTEPHRRVPGSAFCDWLSRPAAPARSGQTNRKGSMPSDPPPCAEGGETAADKPFAHLRKVIG